MKIIQYTLTNLITGEDIPQLSEATGRTAAQTLAGTQVAWRQDGDRIAGYVNGQKCFQLRAEEVIAPELQRNDQTVTFLFITIRKFW